MGQGRTIDTCRGRTATNLTAISITMSGICTAVVTSGRSGRSGGITVRVATGFSYGPIVISDAGRGTSMIPVSISMSRVCIAISVSRRGRSPDDKSVRISVGCRCVAVMIALRHLILIIVGHPRECRKHMKHP